MKTQKRFVIAAIVCLCVVPAQVLAGGGWGWDGDPANPVVPPGSWGAAIVGGYGNLADDWYNWALGSAFEGDDGIGLPPNPLTDETGALCNQNQDGRVFYLAGRLGSGSVTRECTVPRGKFLFFPLFGTLALENRGDTVEEIRAFANSAIANFDDLELSLKVDDVPIGDLFAYRTQSPPGGGSYFVEPGSLGEFSKDPLGLNVPTVADGYWVLLKPLPPGEHVIEFAARTGSIDRKITYNLTVKGRKGRSHYHDD